jgi:fused signal recognition particle receptor
MFAEDRTFHLPEGRLAVVLVAGTGRSVPAGAIGKLAHRLVREGRSVAVGTSDTQRTKVMAEWAQRAGAHPVDNSSRPWTPVAAAVEGARGHDVLLLEAIRPARRGQPRLSTPEVRRAVEAAAGRPPDVVVLVLDAATVAHVVPQARALVHADVPSGVLLTGMGLASTKATALRVREALGLPVWFVATGEGLEDLEAFEPRAYASSLVR